MNRKTKTGLLRLKLSCGALRFNPARLWGVENAVKGRDERRKKRAALDSIFNAMPPSVFFYLDTAVVVIDRMTAHEVISEMLKCFCPQKGSHSPCHLAPNLCAAVACF